MQDQDARSSKLGRSGPLRRTLARNVDSVRRVVTAVVQVLKQNSMSLGALLALDALLAAFVLHGLSFSRGMIVIGDLPGFYYTNGVDVHWATSLALYPLSEQLLADAIGRALAQNLLYMVSVFAPSVGCYFFLQSILPKRWLGVAVAFAFTTFVNPLTSSNFSGGGWFYFGWAAFSFLALALAWRAVCHPTVTSYAIGSGLLVGVAAVQMDGYSGLQYFGTAADLCIIGTLYLYAVCRWYPRLKPVLWSATTLVGSFVLVGLPVLARAYARSLAATSTASQLAGIHAYVYGSIAFTFKQYGPYNALLAGPLVATYSAWNVPFSLSWTLLVALALVGGMYATVSRRDSVRWLALILLSDDLFVCAFMAGVQSGVLVPLFNRAGLLDFMDNPVAFLYIQFLLLPPMAFIGAETIAQRIGFVPTELRVMATTGVSKAKTDERPDMAAVVRAKPLTPRLREAVSVGLILLLALATCVQFDGNYAHRFDTAPSTQGVSPYTPVGFSSIQAWYLHVAASQPGQILALPDSFPLYTKFWGFIPMSRLWVIPSLDNLLNNSYNVSQFVSIMSLAATDQMSQFAQTLGVAGVAYVLLYNQSSEITVIPNYLVATGVSVPASSLWAALDQSPAFRPERISSTITVFQDDDYLPNTGQFHSVVSFGIQSPVGPPLLTRDILVDGAVDNVSQVASWIRYPASTIQVRTGVGTMLSVDSDSSTPYSEFAGALNLTNTSQEAPVRLTNNLSLSSALIQRTFDASAEFSIPTGLGLDIFLASYNQTPLPATLFPLTSLSLLGAYGASDHSANVTDISIPSWVESARLYFYAFSAIPLASGTITISSASFDLSTIAVDVASNSTLQLESLGQLQSAELLPGDSFVLYSPFDVVAPSRIPGSLVEVADSPALEMFNSSTGEISFGSKNLCQTECPTGGVVTPFLSGVADSALTVTTFLNGSEVAQFSETPGNFTIPFAPSPSGSATRWSAEFGGTATLGLCGAVVAGTPGSAASKAVVVLPVGTLSLSFGAETGGYSRSFFVVESGYAVDFEDDSTYVPLPAAVLLCATVLFWTSAKPAARRARPRTP